MTNRSVPTTTVLPHVMYPDVAEALVWLTANFGFTEHYRYGDAPSGAQMRLGQACLMLKRGPAPQQISQYLTIFVEDVQEHYEKTVAAGAKIFEELNETVYGERQYGVEDFAGHRWLFSQHVQDLDPAAWGAIVKL